MSIKMHAFKFRIQRKLMHW